MDNYQTQIDELIKAGAIPLDKPAHILVHHEAGCAYSIGECNCQPRIEVYAKEDTPTPVPKNLEPTTYTAPPEERKKLTPEEQYLLLEGTIYARARYRANMPRNALITQDVERGLTYEQISKKFGVSKKRVRQIYSQRSFLHRKGPRFHRYLLCMEYLDTYRKLINRPRREQEGNYWEEDDGRYWDRPNIPPKITGANYGKKDK